MADLKENSTVMGGSGVEEISPDLLKNTPSNIRKLEDEIEHLKGRQKYHAQTRSPSDGGDVRWYYCKVPLAENELAASVPRTEIVGKSEYFRFGMRDSLAIEASFLQREEELLSSWWGEHAECSVGPRLRASSKKKSDSKVDESSSDSFQSAKLYEDEEERVGVPVKGGLYEVDLAKRRSFPVYWHGENRRVLRGHWFARKGGLDWLPIREDVAEQLEVAYRNQVWHRRTFQPSGLFAARVDLQGFTPGLHALFTGEDNTWEAWLNVDPSGFSSVISFGGDGIKLRRGYSASNFPKPTQDELRQRKEEEMDDYCSQVPVRHLVFMVHGIGQRLEKSNLVDDVANFRHITATLSEQHLTSHQRDSQRVLYIPCQWRKGLKLSGESAVDKITLDGVKGLRVMLSATVHDVLYYMSPIYCQDIINSVSNQLNRLYLKFIKRNPGYDGKVSIYGHSLGSVLSYDILCHQENLSSPFPMDWMYKEHSKDDESSPDINNQSINSNIPNTSDMNETKGIAAHGEGETIVAETVFKHEGGHGEIFSTNAGPIMSQLDPMTSMNGSMDLLRTSSEGDAQQPVHDFCHIPPQEEEGGSGESKSVDCSASASGSEKIAEVDLLQTSSEEDAHQLVHDDCQIPPQEEEDGSGESKSVDCFASASGSEKIAEVEHNNSSDNEEAIKLREEIESLRAKIAELESQVKNEDTGNEAIATTPLAPASRKNECQLSPEPDNSLKSYTPFIRYTKLEFKVDTFFAVGSPLGVFLSLRNIRLGIGKGKDYWDEENIIEEMPACRRMLNIFHPFDPVAYRIEPLVCKEYIDKRPVIVPYHKGGKRLHIGFQELTEDLAARSQAIRDQFNSVRVGTMRLSGAKVLTVCQSNADDIEDAVENSEGKEERSYGSIMMERLTGSEEGRIDHMLQDKTFEHPYLQAIGAHTNYWRDFDTALFILKHLFGDIPDDPNSMEESNRGSSKAETLPSSFSNPMETVDENLPLTSSVKSKTTIVRSFSSRASKFWKKP